MQRQLILRPRATMGHHFMIDRRLVGPDAKESSTTWPTSEPLGRSIHQRNISTGIRQVRTIVVVVLPTMN